MNRPSKHRSRTLVLALCGLAVAAASASAQRRVTTEQLVLDDNQNPVGTITIKTPTAGTPGFSSYVLTLPEAPPSATSVLTSNATGQLQWVATIPQAGGWLLQGNSGTTAGTNFLGTTDNQAFQIHVNNLAATPNPNQGNGRVLRFEPTTNSPNIIAGFKLNSVAAGSRGATIGGGGDSVALNRVTGTTSDFATIGGGRGNTVSAIYGTVIGGANNTASGDTATAMGSGNTASGPASTAFGSTNTASARAAVAMGSGNTASGVASFAMGQSVTASGTASVAIGNNITSGSAANTVAMGQNVNATAANAIVIGSGQSSGSRLVNNTANSLMVGFGSTVPTLFVGPSAGVDNRGNVGIGTATPGSRLTVRAEDNLATKSVLNVTDNSGTSAMLITNDRRVGIGGATDPKADGTHRARVQLQGMTNGVFGVGRPVTYAFVVNNAVGDPLLRIRDDGRMQLRTASADFSGLTSRGSIGPAVDSAYDLGSCGLQWRDLYLGRTVYFNAINCASPMGRAEMGYNYTNSFFDIRTYNGTNTATAMVISETNRRVGLTDGTGASFTATPPQGALDIRSTTGALIVPRMTYNERIALTGVQNGSLVYQTNTSGVFTEGFWAYEGGAWVRK